MNSTDSLEAREAAATVARARQILAEADQSDDWSDRAVAMRLGAMCWALRAILDLVDHDQLARALRDLGDTPEGRAYAEQVLTEMQQGQEADYQPVEESADAFLRRFLDCSDTMPSEWTTYVGDEVGYHGDLRGMTYGVAANVLLVKRAAGQDAAQAYMEKLFGDIE